MQISKINSIIEQGEGIHVEFKEYSDPQLIEENIFKTIIPLSKESTIQATEQVPSKYQAS